MKRGLVVAAALLLIAGSAWAQGGQGGGRRMGGMMGGGFGLLAIPKVQEELKMTQAQIDKVPGKQQEVQQAMRDAFQAAGGPQAFQSMSPEERQKLLAKVQEANNKAVSDILDTNQVKRFKQLQLQQQGPQAFGQKPLEDALQLTTEQKDKIAGILRDLQQARRDAIQAAGGFQALQNMTEADRAKLAETNQKNTADAMAKITAVLTADQQKQYKDMIGEPFTFPPMQFGGRRPGA